MTKVLSLVLLAAGWAVGGLAGSLVWADTMTDLWHRRDEWARHKTFEWGTATTVRWKLDTREEAMLRSRPGYALPPLERFIEGQLTIARVPELTYVEHAQIRATIPEQTGRFICWLGGGYTIANEVTSEAIGTFPSPLLVFPAAGDALYGGMPAVPTGDEVVRWIHPSFLASASPDRVQAPLSMIVRGAKVTWKVAQRQNGFVVLKPVFSPSTPYASGEVWVDPKRQFAPAYFRAHTESDDLEYRVTRWSKVEGWWLPAEVELRVKNQTFRTQRTQLVLRSVFTSPAQLNINLPAGIPVIDLRKVPLDVIMSKGLLGVRGNVYHYTWSGYLPREDMLPSLAVRTEEPFRMVNMPPVQEKEQSIDDLLRWFLPPLLLVLIGALWYWRLKVKKVA